MRLILIRHGPAEDRDPERWPDDLARPLTARGENRSRNAAAGLARLEPHIGKVFSSPAVRALGTARSLGLELGGAVPVEVLAALAPGGDPHELLRAVAREGREATVAIVGHEPDLTGLAAMLLGMRAESLGFKKAGACAIEWTAPGLGEARLRWWLAPAALRAIRQRRRGRVA